MPTNTEAQETEGNSPVMSNRSAVPFNVRQGLTRLTVAVSTE